MTFRLKRDHKKNCNSDKGNFLFISRKKTEFKKISESEKWYGKFGIKTS